MHFVLYRFCILGRYSRRQIDGETDMLHRLIRWCAVALICCSPTTWAADAPVEGQDYRLLIPAQPTDNPSKVVVTEFFSYECSHCFEFYPFVTSWSHKLPSDVVFQRVPISLGRAVWVPAVQVFYALQAVGKLDQLDGAIFRGIHMENARLLDDASMIDFVAKHGVNKGEFAAAYNSFGVKSSTMRADQLMKSYRIQGTPTMVVDGKYVVMSEGTRSFEELLARTDKVIAKARVEKGRK